MPIRQKRAEDLLSRAYGLENEHETKELYRDWAQTYDTTMLDDLGYLTPKKTASLLANSMANREADILDVGSGTGLAGECLARLGYSIIDGLDYSPEMLAVAKERKLSSSRVYRNLIQADLNRPLEIASDSYDALICTGTFTHAHVGPGCMVELSRILKPGGFLACTIQKDVWTGAGFNQVIKKLEKEKVFQVRHFELGTFFIDDTEPQGWYVLCQAEGLGI